jgi:prophage regulatory protein
VKSSAHVPEVDVLRDILAELRSQRVSVDGFLSMKGVEAKTSLSRRTILDLEREGKFPRRFRITDNRVGWKESEVQAWIDSREREYSADDEAQ